jgi:N-acetyl-gamma-glutamyl-phosphate reductase
VISDLYNRFPRLVILDLAADFRLADVAVYARWYGEHRDPDLQRHAVYGLVELHRESIRQARLVAVPGCFPTLAQLVLVPLTKAGVIVTDDVIVDAKCGVTGAGRAAKEATLFCEVFDGFKAYSVAAHRHSAEIEQGMGWAGAGDVVVNFTPHLVPMNRGILESIYVRHAQGQDHARLRRVLEDAYRDEPFIQVLPEDVFPQTQHVRGTNQVRIGLIADRIPGRTIIVAVEDNLTKGSSGQAIQNFNVVFGYPETTGLTAAPLFP